MAPEIFYREQPSVRPDMCQRSPLGLPHTQNRMSGRPRVAEILVMSSPVHCCACLCPTVTHSLCVLPAAPLKALLVVLYKRCEGLCQPPAPENTHRMSPSIHNADPQLNCHDCSVWTCYSLYHHALQGVIRVAPHGQPLSTEPASAKYIKVLGMHTVSRGDNSFV